MRNRSHLFVFLVLLIAVEAMGHYDSNIFYDNPLIAPLPFPLDTIKDPAGLKLKKQKKKLRSRAVERQDRSKSAARKKADELYDALGYMKAADLYKGLKGGDKNQFVIAKIANSYRLNAQWEEAEYWYAQIIKDTGNPKNFLYYAQVLQSNGKCEDAVRWYREYLKYAPDEKREFISNCEDLADFNKSEVVVKNLNQLNTEFSDFSPIPYKNGLLITSNRSAQHLAKRQDNWTKKRFTDLYFAEKGKEGNYDKINPLPGDVNSKFHDGVPTFNRSGTEMIFTRNQRKGKTWDGRRNLKLYAAENQNGFWTNVHKLDLNEANYSYCHPTLSKNGRRLYFASDREGGYGGMDLYVSERIGSHWSEPQNLGPIVNTSGNEIFPFLATDGTLYFASNGHRGLGGLDIFRVQKSKKTDELSWSFRDNLGVPINSEKDDFGFVINPDRHSGYFSSNREGGIGADDIFSWNGNLASIVNRKICVIDKNTGGQIKGVSVRVTKAGGTNAAAGSPNDKVITLQHVEGTENDYVFRIVDEKGAPLKSTADLINTDDSGSFLYSLDPESNYRFVLEKTGYVILEQSLPASKLLAENEFCFALEKESCLKLDGLVKNKDFPAIIPGAEVRLLNKCTGEFEVAMSDKNGKFDFCLACDCEYEIYATKPDFENGLTLLSTRKEDCKKDAPTPVTAEIALKPRMGIGTAKPYKTPAYSKESEENNAPPRNLNKYFLGDENKPFEAGQTFRLTNIYYDYDKYYIRPDAANELDNLYRLLAAYPKMEISLMAHTDSRGTERYNQWLSRKRVKAAINYLVGKGINPRRLAGFGYGESKLTNHCVNDVPCTEAEHQQNRRTEFSILKMGDSDIQIDFKN